MTDLNMIDVLEVDQWTSTGDIKTHAWDALKSQGIDAIKGGDSEAAKIIFGGRLWFRTVSEKQTPNIGSVWFRKDDNGYPALYLANYDSSD